MFNNAVLKYVNPLNKNLKKIENMLKNVKNRIKESIFIIIDNF